MSALEMALRSLDTSATENSLRSSESAPNGHLYREAFQQAMEAPLGVLYNLVPNTSGRRLVPRERPEEIARAREELRHDFENFSEPDPEFRDYMRGLLNPRKMPDGSVQIEFSSNNQDLWEPPARPEDLEISRLIKARFLAYYVRTVNFVYRMDQLIENTPEASARLMDEPTAYLKDKGLAMRYFLRFDPAVWEVQMKLIDSFRRRILHSQDPHQVQTYQKKLEYANEPFLPLAGVALTESIEGTSFEVEPKRYFKNDLQDPLKMLSLGTYNGNLLRLKMLHSAIRGLPPSIQRLEVHADSPIHARLYKNWGFRSLGESIDEKFSRPSIRMVGTREEVLHALSVQIAKDEASPPAR